MTAAQPAPQPGDFFVARSVGPFSWLTRLVTRSHYAHAGFFVTAGTVVEAEPGGARLTPWSHFTGKVVRTSAGVPGFELTDDQRRHAAAVGMSLVGTPYGFLDLLCIGLLQFGVRPRWVRNRVRRSDRLICSQLVDLARLALGSHLFDDGRLPQDVSPGDLADLIGLR